jgi:hypothetical protein
MKRTRLHRTAAPLRAPGPDRFESPSESGSVPHYRRAQLTGREPVLATLRLEADLPSLRRVRELKVVYRALNAGRVRPGFRLVRCAVRRDRLLLLVEAADSDQLSSNLQGIAIRIAKNLNGAWERTGKVWADRYGARILRTEEEAHSAVAETPTAFQRPRTRLLTAAMRSCMRAAKEN